MHLSSSQLESIVFCLQANTRIVAAYLLGSVLTEHFRPQSDIDLALLTEPHADLSQYERLTLATELEKSLGHTVDIGQLNTRNLIYAQETITKGQCIFCRDTDRRDLFAATALSLYTELKQERREIENAYRA